MFGFGKKKDGVDLTAVRSALANVMEDIANKVAQQFDGVATAADLQGKINALTAQLERLKIEKDRKDEDFARMQREVEHKVGLERERQKFEVDAAKREATLTVREENLKADRERFEEQMEFQTKRLEGEVTSLRDLVSEMLKRLPSAEIAIEVQRGGNTTKRK